MQTEIFQKSAARAQQVRQQLPGELLQLYAPALAAVAKASALALARQGANVLLHGRNQQRLETTLRDIQDVTGERHLETYLPASGLQWSPILSATANRCSL